MAAYEVLLLNTAIPQIQAAQSGDTYVVPRDIAFSAALTLSAGTANGVPYLNGSKVLTTGSALTFDGTQLSVSATVNNAGIFTSTATTTALVLNNTHANGWGSNIAINTGGVAAGYFGTIGSLLGSTAQDLAVYATSGNGFRVYTSGNNLRATFDSSGRLLVGVTVNPGGGNLEVISNGVSAFTARSTSSGASTTVKAVRSVSSDATDFANAQYDALSHGWILSNGSQAMTLDASGRLGIGATSPLQLLHLSSATSPKIQITYQGVGASQIGIDASNNLIFGLDTSNGATERARITSSGVFGVGCDPAVIWPSAASSSGDNGSTIAETYVSVSSNASILQYLNRNNGNGTITQYYHNGTAVGSVSVTSTATAYNTSSDYRLKDNQQPLTGSGAFIDALQPKTWDWKSGGKGVGFIAHEVQEVSPGSVVGEKDAVDADGKPIMQAMEYGSAEFIANIIAELQSLRARVKALEGA